MQYSPKLKGAMEEIKAILKKHDIAGFVILHTPGYCEFLNHVNPSYSCVFVKGDLLGVRLKESELPGGREQAKQIANATYNMVSSITEMLVMNGSAYIGLKEMLKKQWGEDDGDPGTLTTHTQQNN